MNKKRDILIGGAWPYANYYLHIGHLAALLPGDILARYFRLHNDNVIYISGSDSHGTPITQRAEDEKTTPEAIASFYHQEFVNTFNKANFTYDEYSSTMDDYHIKYVQKCFLTLKENGYIYEKESPQDYCDTCQKFLADRQILGICPVCGAPSNAEVCDACTTSLDAKDLLDKRCKKCNNPTVMKNNKHLYFELSKFEEPLKKYISQHKATWRKNAYGESLKYIQMGLLDRAVTRQLEWGIDVPVDGYDDKRIYVWIEAVLGYLSMASKVAQNNHIDFDKFMSNDNPSLITYYVHGKDNIPFHTIIYPALILGLKNNYRLPDKIISSAYVNLNDEKMSKSKGNLVTVNELLHEFGIDTIRYYLISNGPENKDTNCTKEEIIQTHNKFLVGVLGNFINRNLAFINKKFNGEIKEGIIEPSIVETTKKIYDEASLKIENGELKAALNLIMDYVTHGNKYYDDCKPWLLAKDNIQEFNNVTYTCVYMIKNIACLIAPFIPDTSKKISQMLGFEKFDWEEQKLQGDLQIKEVVLLFERI